MNPLFCELGTNGLWNHFATDLDLSHCCNCWGYHIFDRILTAPIRSSLGYFISYHR